MNGAGALLRYMRRLVRYNVWANERIADLCRSMDTSMFEHVFEGSFPSIRSTVCHLWDAEYIWFNRLHGSSPAEFPSRSKQLRRDQICDGMIHASNNFQRYVEALSDSDVNSTVEYLTTRGQSYSNTVDQIISHTMNHSTYHRGQVILYARLLGVDHPASTDQILYFRLTPD